MKATSSAIARLQHVAELYCSVQVLYEDKQLQQTIFVKHRDELRALDKKIDTIRVRPASSAPLLKCSTTGHPPPPLPLPLPRSPLHLTCTDLHGQ